MATRGHYVDVDTSLSLSKPELRVRIDRDRASDLGVSVQTVASTLGILVGGEPVSKFKEETNSLMCGSARSSRFAMIRPPSKR